MRPEDQIANLHLRIEALIQRMRDWRGLAAAFMALAAVEMFALLYLSWRTVGC